MGLDAPVEALFVMMCDYTNMLVLEAERHTLQFRRGKEVLGFSPSTGLEQELRFVNPEKEWHDARVFGDMARLRDNAIFPVSICLTKSSCEILVSHAPYLGIQGTEAAMIEEFAFRSVQCAEKVINYRQNGWELEKVERNTCKRTKLAELYKRAGVSALPPRGAGEGQER